MKKANSFRNKTMRSLQKWLVLSVSLLLFTACGSDRGSNNDRAALSDEIASSEFFSQSLTDTDEDAALAKEIPSPSGQMLEKEALAPAEGTASPPFLWWRTDVHRTARDMDISITGDTASVKVIDHLEGNLKIIPQQGVSPWDKPFEETFTRYAEFTRNPVSQRPPLWQLTQLSPVDASLEDPTQQTVHMDWVRASKCLQIQGNSCASWEKVWESLSPASLFTVADEWPTFHPGDLILVETKVSNTDTSYEPTEFVFLHRPGRRHEDVPGRVRDRMADDGTLGDQQSNDGIYSRTYLILNPGRHFAAVDVLNSATFMEEDAPYNATGWGVPYRVVAP